MYGQLRKEILHYYRRAYETGLMAGTSGNASARCPDEGRMLITPSGVEPDALTEESLVLTDLSGNVLSGGIPSSEWRMHAAIYETHSDVGAVLHTHSHYATAFAVAGREIPEVLEEMRLFTGGAIPVTGYAPAGSALLAQQAAQALTRAPVCLLRNHGVTAVGATIREAFLRVCYAEDGAKIYCTAKLLGEPLLLPD